MRSSDHQQTKHLKTIWRQYQGILRQYGPRVGAQAVQCDISSIDQLNTLKSLEHCRPVYLFAPNLVGYFRLCLLAGSLITGTGWPFVTLALFSFNLLLDGLDGFLARRLDQVLQFCKWHACEAWKALPGYHSLKNTLILPHQDCNP